MKICCMSGEVVRSWDGYAWYIEGDSDRLVLNDGEMTVRTVLRELGRLDRVFVDVGAHVGEYAIRMAYYYHKVIAIEPIPRSVRILKKNIELNHIANIEVKQVACSDKEEVLTFRLRGGSSTALECSGKFNVIKVKAVRLDDLVDWCDVIKIDVEGWEEKVIKGASRIIKECKPVIVIEHHEFRGYDSCKGMKERIIKILSGYRHFDLNGIHTLYVPKSFNIEEVKDAIVYHWVMKAIKNLEQGKPWYYGMPKTWWYGGHIIDFMLALPEHILKEKEWIEKL